MSLNESSTASVEGLTPFFSRALYMVISAPFIFVGFAIFVGTNNVQARYGATFLIAIGSFSFGAMCNAWASINTTSDTARAATIGMVVFAGNCGGLISTWLVVLATLQERRTRPDLSFFRSYLPKFAPQQIPGNALNTGTGSLIFLLSGGLWLWMIRENKRKDEGRDDAVLEGLSPEEVSMLGQKHPGFRYRT